MIPAVYVVPDELTSPLFAKAFADGCGGIVTQEYQPGVPFAGSGSPKNWDMLAAPAGRA